MADLPDGARMHVTEEAVLEKYDGDPPDGRLVERITVRDGVVVSRETFDTEDTEEI